jgi:hypothetical protein
VEIVTGLSRSAGIMRVGGCLSTKPQRRQRVDAELRGQTNGLIFALPRVKHRM